MTSTHARAIALKFVVIGSVLLLVFSALVRISWAGSASVFSELTIEGGPTLPAGTEVVLRGVLDGDLMVDYATLVREGNVLRVTFFIADYVEPGVVVRRFHLGKFPPGEYRIDYYAAASIVVPGDTTPPAFVGSDVFSVGAVAVTGLQEIGLIAMALLIAGTAMRRGLSGSGIDADEMRVVIESVAHPCRRSLRSKHAAGERRTGENMKRLIAAALVAAMGSGCATITRGSSQAWTVESKPSGAEVVLSSGETCKTPCTLEKKRKHSFSVTIKKEGYEQVVTDIVSAMSGAGGAAMAGNVLVGGIIGAGIDAGSGATKDLKPNPLVVDLVPLDATSEVKPESSTPTATVGESQQ